MKTQRIKVEACECVEIFICKNGATQTLTVVGPVNISIACIPRPFVIVGQIGFVPALEFRRERMKMEKIRVKENAEITKLLSTSEEEKNTASFA